MRFVTWMALAAIGSTNAFSDERLVEKIQRLRWDESRRGVVLPSEIRKNSLELPGTRAALERWLSNAAVALQQPATPEAIKSLSDQVLRAVGAPDASHLDLFPILSLEHIHQLQEAMLHKPTPETERLTAPLEKKVVIELGENCKEEAGPIHSPVVDKLFIQQTSEPLDQAIEPCFARNSRALSLALNLVAQRAPFVLDFQRDGKSTSQARIDGERRLLHELSSKQLHGEIFIKRTLVDFFGYSYQPPGTQARDLRLLLWIAVPMPDGTTVPVPAEHADYGILLTRDGQNRFAESRYFMGVPTSQQTSVSFWRPREVKNASWTQSKLERVKEVHSADLAATPTVRWIAAAGKAIRTFESLNHRFNAGYGQWVCNDSVALALSTVGTMAFDCKRRSDVFPLVRSTAFPLDADLEAHYPADLALSQDPSAMQARLAKAFPIVDKHRFAFCPETLAAFENHVWPKQP